MVFFKYNNGNDGFFTDTPNDTLMELLINKTHAAGHMLTFNEASADPTMVDPNIYAYYFGRSFSDVSKLAWKKVCKEENNPTERKAQEETKMSMRGRYAKIVKDSLRRYYIEHEYWPTRDEIEQSPEFPSYATILKYCGHKIQWVQTVFDGILPTAASSARALSASAIQGDENLANQAQINQKVPIVIINLTEHTADTATNDKASSPTNDVSVDETTISAESGAESAANQAGDPMDIELKIILPNRNKPIMVKLSF